MNELRTAVLHSQEVTQDHLLTRARFCTQTDQHHVSFSSMPAVGVVNPTLLADHYMQVTMRPDLRSDALKKMIVARLKNLRNTDILRYEEIVQSVMNHISSHETVHHRGPLLSEAQTEPPTPANSTVANISDIEGLQSFPLSTQLQRLQQNRQDAIFLNTVTNELAQEAQKLSSRLSFRQKLLIGAVIANIVQLSGWIPAWTKK